MYSTDKQESQRIQIVKVICTILIIFIHMNNEFTGLENGMTIITPYWLETFKYIVSECLGRAAVPLFFLFSSVLFHSRDIRYSENIKKKFRTLFVPYVMCISISIYILVFYIAQSIPAISPYFSNSDNTIRTWTWLEWIDAYIGKIADNQPFCVPLWFIRDLMILNIMGHIPQRIIGCIPKISLVIITAIWLWNLQTTVIDVQALVFWNIGILIVKYNFHMKSSDKISWKLVICIPILIILDWCCKYNIIHQFSILVYMLFIVKASDGIVKSKYKQIFIYLMQYSLFIYMFHILVLTALKKVAVRLLVQTFVVQLTEYCLFPFMTAGICVLGAILMKKICPPFYKLLVGGRK